jgi:predicted ATPase
LASQIGIQRVVIEGLHEQFDVDVTLNPRLNIIYGKNGRGKTTLLHIIVNALELDFDRFSNLNFGRITITAFNGTALEITKGPDGKAVTRINGELAALDLDPSGILSFPEVELLRESLGARPVYLPAFRSVLERVRNDYANPYREPNREAEIDALGQSEYNILRELSGMRTRDGLDARSLRDEAQVTARKTVQCRQWFGPFVPVIRYPSILEVDDGLSSEWRTAQLKLAQREQSMFADVFAKVFRTVVGLDSNEVEAGSEETLLKSISQFLSETDSQTGIHGPNPIYAQLREATEFLRSNNSRGSNEIGRAVLQVYMDTLSDRKEARTQAFQSSRDFELSINKFLDKKKLRIGDEVRRSRMRSFVNVGTDGGRYYGLSALSSGEKQILTMLYSASRSKFRGGMFLIDEPELSLHIDWQRQILAELMAQTPQCQIIACTHSPEVGADHLAQTQDFEPVPTEINRADADLFDDLDHLEE